MTATHLFAGALVAVWILVGIGYAIAKTFRARLIIADELELDRENRAFRLVVRCEGFGEIEPRGTVVDLRDAVGQPILPEAVVGLPLHWTHRASGEKVTMTEDSPKESFTVLYVKSQRFGSSVAVSISSLCIYSPDPPDHLQPIDHDLRPGQADRLWIKLRVSSRHCPTVEKWYTLEHTPTLRAYYRPIPLPDPLPTFCT